jgi:hydroxyacylglutathione hydrolase
MIVQIRLGLSNVFLVRGERPILVDSGRPKDAGTIVAALKDHGVAPADLALILHTHGHWDHCGGTRQLKEWTTAPVAIHRGDADKLRRGVNGVLRATCLTGFLLKPLLNPAFPGVEPDLVIEDGFDLRRFGMRAQVVHTPGHTSGSISLVSEAGEAVVGDLLMGGYLGGKVWRSRPNLHYFVEDRIMLESSLRRLLELAPSIIYTGHGGPLDPEAVRRRFRLASERET